MITIFGSSDSYSRGSRQLYPGSGVGGNESSKKADVQTPQSLAVSPVFQQQGSQADGHDMSHLQGRETQFQAVTGKSEKEEKGKEQKKVAEESSQKERSGNQELTPEQQRRVQELKKRDAEVRRHEQAHAAAGGAHTGSPSYSYERGPDGRTYVVDGEVSVDASPVSGNPEATIQKMRQVKAAAMAPASPSSQDRRVAARAAAQMLQAQKELSEQKVEFEFFGKKGEGEEEKQTSSATTEVSRSQGSRSYRTTFHIDVAPISTIEVLACSGCGKAHSV